MSKDGPNIDFKNTISPGRGVSSTNKMWREHHAASIEKMDKVIKKKKAIGKAKREAAK